ncbi:glutathione S-transferase family protein, partial [Mycobacterium tuberculosis]|nr:glutathione S-transferase family protein [Mycobacterium tuberculosis]
VNRYTNEAKRLYGVIDKRLGESKFLGGADYSIADMASFGWIVSHANQGQDLNDFPNLKRWFEAISARPAVQRGRDLGKEARRNLADDKDAQKILFGQRAR